MATADLNAGGFSDLVVGYGAADGGFLLDNDGDKQFLRRLRDIKENRFPVPFGKVSVVKLAEAPDYLFTGDFDLDSRMDILTAAKGGDALNFSLSDVNYRFDTLKSVALAGRITALTVGEKKTAGRRCGNGFGGDFGRAAFDSARRRGRAGANRIAFGVENFDRRRFYLGQRFTDGIGGNG